MQSYDDVITIVSGLPRSGTSMMMKMLDHGGLPVLVDHIREADEDNPLGYYEFEPVKNIERDTDWLAGAVGKVVKMVSMLLFHLPTDHSYKVIFMERHFAEILASQKKMLERAGKLDGGQPDDHLIEQQFIKHVGLTKKWLDAQSHIDVYYVSYNSLIEEAPPVVRAINQFLGGKLDEEKMVSVISPELYRHRSHGQS
jgi:hypothetical protein